jgi:hypothetical protein
MQVAGKVWLQVEEGRPAAMARRFSIRFRGPPVGGASPLIAD